jgi:anaerobic selenocysteine-containing dehydrogenase
MLNSASVTVHHTNGVQNHRAVTALIGLTGNFDRKGGNQVIPSTYYHAPTGLVSREYEFEQVRTWEEMAPRIGSEKFPVWASIIPEAQSTEIPFRIRSGKPYPVKAMVTFGLNHRMWPGSDSVKEALQTLDFLVDTDLFMTDSARLADIVLPACSGFEREELRIYPSRYAFWAEPVIDPLGESRSDVDIIIALSKKLNPEDTLMARGQEACFDWMFEPSGIRMGDIKANPGGGYLEDRTRTPYEKYRETGFNTPSGKMEFHSRVLERFGMDPLPVFREPKHSPVSTPEIANDFPLILTTGARMTMLMHSRMYRVESARKTRPDPAVDMHPEDASRRGIAANDWVNLITPRGSIRVRANLTDLVPQGVVNMYHGDPKGDVNELIDPDYRDPVSGYPGYKSMLCEIAPV